MEDDNGRIDRFLLHLQRLQRQVGQIARHQPTPERGVRFGRLHATAAGKRLATAPQTENKRPTHPQSLATAEALVVFALLVLGLELIEFRHEPLAQQAGVLFAVDRAVLARHRIRVGLPVGAVRSLALQNIVMLRKQECVTHQTNVFQRERPQQKRNEPTIKDQRVSEI